MKTASSDEELAFKQKERDVALYTRKANSKQLVRGALILCVGFRI